MTREFLVIVLAAGPLWAGSPFAGRWMGEIEGLPGVRLTVQEDQGRLSGSIVFYLIVKDEKGAHVDSDYKADLLNVTAKGRRMTFEVRHHISHDSPEYGPNVKFAFELAGENKEGMLRNVPDGLSVRMLREP
jgi:hypothetical protein